MERKGQRMSNKSLLLAISYNLNDDPLEELALLLLREGKCFPFASLHRVYWDHTPDE